MLMGYYICLIGVYTLLLGILHNTYLEMIYNLQCIGSPGNNFRDCRSLP